MSSASLILPYPTLSSTERAERSLADLLSDLDKTEDAISQLDAGICFDASLEIRTARAALRRALQAVAEPALVEVA